MFVVRVVRMKGRTGGARNRRIVDIACSCGSRIKCRDVILKHRDLWRARMRRNGLQDRQIVALLVRIHHADRVHKQDDSEDEGCNEECGESDGGN